MKEGRSTKKKKRKENKYLIAERVRKEMKGKKKGKRKKIENLLRKKEANLNNTKKGFTLNPHFLRGE